MKKPLALFICLIMIISSVPVFTASAEESLTANPEAYPDYCDPGYGALYAHAIAGDDSSQTWQRWHKDVLGFNAERDVRYFFLPKTADDNKIEIYNNYSEGTVTIGDTVIESHRSAIVEYSEGEKIIAYRNKGTANEKRYTFMVIKSDAEASVYVNDASGSYVDCNGKTQTTDLWSFLIQNKENSVADSKCSIVDENGVQNTTLKKIKGRGNTNWKETDKKPFNLTFYDKTTIGDTTDKKFSFVSNAKDSTLLRNAIMYDLAYNVDSPYACDQSFVDFFVNGVYRGSYIACRKVDLGKNSVVSLKDESDDMDTGFNFLVEVDVWNYKSDVYFVSDQGYHVVLKTPDLDDYDETDPSMKAKYDFISSTYQRLEDALYEGTLEDVEKICDMDSLATQYLLQEFGKNCDGGYTSTFFTYNAAEDKFYAAPLWDCDSCLGAVDCVREGCSTSTIDHKGWTTRTAKYENTINPLGQSFYVKGTTSDGKTFEDLCSEIWAERFIPQINVLLGNAESAGKLKSIDEYASSIEKSAFINYTMWDFMWNCASKNKSLNKKYEDTVSGETEYMTDWIEARADWISKQFNSETTNTNRTVYFTTDLDWDNVHFYVWSGTNAPQKWPGTSAERTDFSYKGNPVYKAEFADNVTSIIFNNGTSGEQTIDISLSNDTNLYITTNSSGKINEEGYDIYYVDADTFDESQYTTSAETTTPDEVPTTVEITTNATDTSTEATTITSEETEATSTTEVSISTTVTDILSDPTESTSSAAEPTSNSIITTNATSPVITEILTDPTEVTSFTTEPASDSITTTIATSNVISEIATDPTEVSSLASEPESDIFTTEVVPDSTESSSATQIAITITDASSESITSDVTEASTEISSTTATIPTDTTSTPDELLVGDADKDSKISIKDVTIIQKYLAKLITFDDKQLKSSDTTFDNKVTISDATTIQKFIAQLIEKF